MNVLDPEWFSDCEMERIIVHWTAGTYDVSANDRSHYHFLVDKDGGGHLGDNPVSGNAGGPGAVTSHTKNLNTGSIGISVAAMGNAIENPFDPGPWPLTKIQFTALAQACAQLCDFYSIPPEPDTLLMHGEVQKTLGIAQEGKWDIGRLPFAPDSFHNCADVGRFLRELVRDVLEGGLTPIIPKPVGTVTVYVRVEAPPGVTVIIKQEPL